MNKPTVAVYKFSSCDGCQLSLLNLEDELLAVANAVEFAFFLEARRRTLPGPYDIGLIEGSVTTPHELERLREARAQCRTLIALGTCATAGGIQALRNFASAAELAAQVYPHPDYLHFSEQVTPLSAHVKIDLELWGCPVNKYQALEVILALLQKRRPQLPAHPVCLDCKRQGTVCVLNANGQLCLGPVTRAGCGALCPASGRGCYGCFGPAPNAEFANLAATLLPLEHFPGEASLLARHISGSAPQFRELHAALEKGKVKA